MKMSFKREKNGPWKMLLLSSSWTPQFHHKAEKKTPSDYKKIFVYHRTCITSTQERIKKKWMSHFFGIWKFSMSWIVRQHKSCKLPSPLKKDAVIKQNAKEFMITRWDFPYVSIDNLDKCGIVINAKCHMFCRYFLKAPTIFLKQL